MIVNPGGESVYGKGFDNEYHPRLRFRYRGLVGMANDGTKSSNKSQFFITLDRADCLNDKYTLFGKVGGHTLYNLIKIGSIENDKNDRPLNPPKIVRVEVLENAFNDIVPRLLVMHDESENEEEGSAVEQKVAKASRNKALLSFDDEPMIELNKKKRVDNSRDLHAENVHNPVTDEPLTHITMNENFELKATINSLKDEIRGIISKVIAIFILGRKKGEDLHSKIY